MPKQEERTDSFLAEWKRLWEPDMEAIAFNGATCDPTKVDPKVLQWAKSNCSHKPHFIKIINKNAAHGCPGLQDSRQCQMSVPSRFVKEHFRELERVVTLVNDEGKTWRVSFGNVKTYPSWYQGWKRVAADNDLQPGGVMVFTLVANSRFRFTRFDQDGNIINKSQCSTPNHDHTTADRSSTPHFSSREKLTKNPGADISHPRTSWKSKRAATLASRKIGHCTDSPKSGVTFKPTDKQIAELPFKRRKLRKMGDIMSKGVSSDKEGSNLATGIINLEHVEGSTDSTTMADSPSSSYY